MKIWTLLGIFSLPFLLLTAVQAETLNAGLVSGIWYSKTPFFTGETVRMYTAVQNNSGFDIVGKVRFLKNNMPIGETVFSAPQEGLVQIWISWKAQEGNSKIEAEMFDAKRLEIGKDPEPIVLPSALVAQDEIFVDTDTDRDGIGNTQDLDDDNDGISDEKEQKAGTNPLKPDAPQISPKTTFENKYLAAGEQKTDELVGNLVEQLKGQKKQVVKQLATHAQKPLFVLPVGPENSIPSKDEFANLFLATAIAGLSQWRIILLILGGIIAFKLLRKIF